MTGKWKNTLKLSTRTMFEKARPGFSDCAMYHAESSPATAPTNAIRPRGFWLFSSSTSGSSTMTRMPKADKTSSGRMRT